MTSTRGFASEDNITRRPASDRRRRPWAGVIVSSVILLLAFTLNILPQAKKALVAKHSGPVKKVPAEVTGKAASSTSISSTDSSATTTHSSDTNAGSVQSVAARRPPLVSVQNILALMSMRNILFMVLIASLVTNIMLILFGHGLFRSKEGTATKASQAVRIQPSSNVSPKDLQDLREAFDASLKKHLREFGKYLLVELPNRNRSSDNETGPAGEDLGSRGGNASLGQTEVSAPRHRTMQQCIDEFCRGAIGNGDLISAAEYLGLRWGSATPKPGQLRATVRFGSADSRIMVIEKERGDFDYFLVLKDDAFWNFDLELLFDGHAPGGGRPPSTRNTRTLTKKPSVGRLDGSDELKVVEVGSVEVVEV